MSCVRVICTMKKTFRPCGLEGLFVVRETETSIPFDNVSCCSQMFQLV